MPKRNVQHERDLVRRPCINMLRQMIAFNQLKKYPFIYWTCPPDMGKQTPQALGRMKLDGYEKGVIDLTIVAGNADILKVWLIEFKYGSNGLTPEQKNHFNNSVSTPAIALIIKTPEEFESFLLQNLK